MNGPTTTVTSFPASAPRATACSARNRSAASDSRVLYLRPSVLGGPGMRRRDKPPGLLAAPPLLAKAHLLRQSRARLRVGRSDHGIIRGKTPLLTILFRRQVVLGPQMPFQRLEFTTVL